MFRLGESKGGTPLAGGFYALTWCKGGDQDYKRDCLGMANVNSGKPCTHWGPSCTLVFLLYRMVIVTLFSLSQQTSNTITLCFSICICIDSVFCFCIDYVSVSKNAHQPTHHMVIIALRMPPIARGTILDPMRAGLLVPTGTAQTAQPSRMHFFRVAILIEWQSTLTGCTINL